MLTVPPPSVESERGGRAASQLHASLLMNRVERQLWERLQRSIADAEQADMDLIALAESVRHDSGYLQLANAADRSRQARLACDQAFAEWKLGTRRQAGKQS